VHGDENDEASDDEPFANQGDSHFARLYQCIAI
jgi:hypothetical protein